MLDIIPVVTATFSYPHLAHFLQPWQPQLPMQPRCSKLITPVNLLVHTSCTTETKQSHLIMCMPVCNVCICMYLICVCMIMMAALLNNHNAFTCMILNQFIAVYTFFSSQSVTPFTCGRYHIYIKPFTALFAFFGNCSPVFHHYHDY